MAKETQHMQKAMVCMNIKLNEVINDITGQTGTNIVNAIINGERNPKRLASLRNARIKCSEATLVKSLEGNWLDDQLFCLKMARDRYRELEQHLLRIDKESERVVKLLAQEGVEEKKVKRRPCKNKQPMFNVEQHLYNVHGVDVMEIYGFKQTSGLIVLSETGPDLKSKFPHGKTVSFLAKPCTRQ